MNKLHYRIAESLALAAAFGVVVLSPAPAQLTAVRPVMTVTTDNQTLLERVDQLSADVVELKAQHTDDTQKISDLQDQVTFDHKLVVNLTNSQANLKSAYDGHTHNYSRTSIGFTNVSLGGGGYASLIQKITLVPEETAPPH